MMFTLKPQLFLLVFAMLVLPIMGGCAPAVPTQTAAPTQILTSTPEPAPTPVPTTAESAPASASSFDDPYSYCAAVGTLDEPDERYVGDELPEVIITGMIDQGIIADDMPASMQENAVWRCMDQKVWVCHFGANLPCMEKADTAREPNVDMEEYCQNDPNVDFIPAAVTGRATVYEWRCKDGVPEVVQKIFEVDAQGYLATFWYSLTESE